MSIAEVKGKMDGPSEAVSWSGPIGLGVFLAGAGVLLAGLGVFLWSFI